MRPVTSAIEGAESRSTEDGGPSRPATLPSKDFVGAAAYLACHLSAHVRFLHLNKLHSHLTTSRASNVHIKLSFVQSPCQLPL